MALNTLGSNRDALVGLALAERERLIREQVLFGDPRRWRPRWFDGRFLAASDLQSEQNYFLVRQTDLGRAAGSGIIDGLEVRELSDTTSATERLRIDPGSGITDTGELVVLPEALVVNPADVPELRRLDAAFGLQVIPNEPGRTRTGLYVLALRPVEWTANPIGAYPTSLTGTRTVEDGTIVEGLAVSLIPYPDQGNEESWERRRARVAREIFVEGRDRGLDSGVLPLAMVALRGNLVEWIDPFLVRRETGAERPAGMDFGFGARALREAHLLQYQQQLADTLNLHQDQAFSATAYFDALPPVGRFPAQAVDPAGLTQRFFPSGVEVHLSFLPEDEIPALIEESLLLPPLDLTLPMEELRGTAVVVLVPLTRAEFATHRTSLPNWDDQPVQLRPNFVAVKALASPRELLLSRLFRAVPVAAPPPEEEAWRQLLRNALNQPTLWYVRRRHLPIPSNAAATPVSATAEAVADARLLSNAVRADPELSTRLERLRTTGLPEAGLLATRLASTRIAGNPPLLRSLLARASGSSDQPPVADHVVSALAPAADPQLGDGLTLLADADPTLGRRLTNDRVADTGLLSDVDRLAREVPAARLPELAAELRDTVGSRGNPPETLAANLAKLRRRFVTPTP